MSQVQEVQPWCREMKTPVMPSYSCSCMIGQLLFNGWKGSTEKAGKVFSLTKLSLTKVTVKLTTDIKDTDNKGGKTDRKQKKRHSTKKSCAVNDFFMCQFEKYMLFQSHFFLLSPWRYEDGTNSSQVQTFSFCLSFSSFSRTHTHT